MLRRIFLALALFASFAAHAALSPAQLVVLKAAIAAETDPTFVGYRNGGDNAGMAIFYNGASSPIFVVWKSNVTIRETGQAFVGSEWAGLTTANHTRLQTVAQYLTSYSPSVVGIRDMFNDIWSGAGGTGTRAALLALWKRTATRAEKLFATGTGSDAVPATLTFEGNVTSDDVRNAVNLP